MARITGINIEPLAGILEILSHCFGKTASPGVSVGFWTMLRVENLLKTNVETKHSASKIENGHFPMVFEIKIRFKSSDLLGICPAIKL